MELKQTYAQMRQRAAFGFNRTFMELKQGYVIEALRSEVF